jgi:cell wall-associated NlpC family hydrolase
MNIKTQLVNIARSYLNTPYQHQGRLKNVGVDCAGFCMLSIEELGYEYYDVKAYDRTPNALMFLKNVEKNLSIKDIKNAEIGDFLIFSFIKEPQHIAIITDLNPVRIIHALEKNKKVVEHIAGDFWESRIRGCYELKNGQLNAQNKVT